MKEKLKIKLLIAFGYNNKMHVEDCGLVNKLQSRLSPAQWIDYIDELKNIVLNDMENHFHIVKKLNTEQATCYFMLAATDEEKGEAMLKALGIF